MIPGGPTMKKLLCCILSLLLTLSLLIPACADSSLPTINSVLRSGASAKKEVSDTLEGYSPLNETFSDISYSFRIIILQREAPKKEFTAKTVYPPFSDSDGYDSGFQGVDIGNERLWVRGDLMKLLPEKFRADSFEDATYLLVAESIYELDGSVSVSNFSDNGQGELPEFEDAEEMIAYFRDHPREVESVTYYPKFGVYCIVSLYEKETKKSALMDFTSKSSRRFARNPEASDNWSNMGYLQALVTALTGEPSADPEAAKEVIALLDFVPQEERDLWTSCIDAKKYSAAAVMITDYYWSMAEAFKQYDPSSKNGEYYDLIIKARNADALGLFVSYCDYSGFDRSVDSIKESMDYIAAPDYDWMEQALEETIALFN